MIEEIHPDPITRHVIRQKIRLITGDAIAPDEVYVNSTMRKADGTTYFIVRSQWVATVKRERGRPTVHVVPLNGVGVN